jgi:hypothetical protein
MSTAYTNARFTWSDATRRWPGNSADCALFRFDLKLLFVRVVIVIVCGVVNGQSTAFLALGSDSVRYRTTGYGVAFNGVIRANSAAPTEALGAAAALRLNLNS